MILKTGTKERKLTINCVAENDQGVVTNTMHVHTHYLPKSVQITGPTSALPGDYAHFTCLTTETFPVPELKWKIEKSGEFYAMLKPQLNRVIGLLLLCLVPKLRK